MSSTKQLISRLSFNTICLSLISAMGLSLSLYTLYVEMKSQNDSKYEAFCDISENISCSKAFNSKYGKGFGLLGKPFDLPNPVLGSVFYLLQLFIANVSNNNLLLNKIYILFAIVSNFGSIYLGFILIYVLHNLCIVCVTIYVINFLMLLFAIYRFKIINSFKRFKKD